MASNYVVDFSKTPAEQLLGLINHDNNLTLTSDDVLFIRPPTVVTGERNTKTVVTTKDPEYVEGTDLISVPVTYNRIDIAHLFSIVGCGVREVELDGFPSNLLLNDKFYTEINRRYGLSLTSDDFSLSRSADNTYTLHARADSLLYIGSVVITIIWSLTTRVPTRLLKGFAGIDEAGYAGYLNSVVSTPVDSPVTVVSDNQIVLTDSSIEMRTHNCHRSHKVADIFGSEDPNVGWRSYGVIASSMGLTVKFPEPRAVAGVSLLALQSVEFETPYTRVTAKNESGQIVREVVMSTNSFIKTFFKIDHPSISEILVGPSTGSVLGISDIAVVEAADSVDFSTEYFNGLSDRAYVIPYNTPDVEYTSSRLILENGIRIDYPERYASTIDYNMKMSLNRGCASATDGYLSNDRLALGVEQSAIRYSLGKSEVITGFVIQQLRADNWGTDKYEVRIGDSYESAEVFHVETEMGIPKYVEIEPTEGSFIFLQAGADSVGGGHLGVGRFEPIKLVK